MSPVSSPREYLDVPLHLIDDPDLPSRSTMDDDAMRELATSIGLIGLQQPMILVRNAERFTLLAGHRRKIACVRAGLAAAPCLVYATRSAADVAIQYAENRFREELNPADEAILFAELLERDCAGDVDRLCEKLGETRTYVENRLLLLRDADVLNALQTRQLSAVGVALQLLKVTDPRMRRYYLDAAIRGGATIAVVSGWVQDWQRQLVAAGGHVEQIAPAAAPGAAPNLDYFRCYICKRNNDVHLMQPINVHVHCQRAILDELLGRNAVESEPKG